MSNPSLQQFPGQRNDEHHADAASPLVRFCASDRNYCLIFLGALSFFFWMLATTEFVM